MVSNNIGHFTLCFHNHGINYLSELRGCSDEFLTNSIGFKQVHLLKFRRALLTASLDSAPEPTADDTCSANEASDSFCGNSDEVLTHEKKLEAARSTLDHPHKNKAARKHTEVTLMRIYEAPDGFHGTYAEVLAHENMLERIQGGEFKNAEEKRGGSMTRRSMRPLTASAVPMTKSWPTRLN